MMNVLCRKLALLAALLLTLGVAACDNPVEDEDHPVGLVLLNAQGAEVARFRMGQGATGSLSVSVSTPQTFRARAFGEDGDVLEIGASTGLGLRVEQPGDLASVAVAGNQLTVTGARAGNATLRVFLQHEGHDEFRADIPLSVTP